MFETSPRNDHILPERIVVCVAEADTPEGARAIHRKIWNLGRSPFLLVKLPNQLRVYSGFQYDEQDPNSGLIDSLDLYTNLLGELDPDVQQRLQEYSAEAINSGQIWVDAAKKIDAKNRVNRRLLYDLRLLETKIVDQIDADEATALRIAHSLIGKYIYLKYLRDRRILSNEWLEEEGIAIGSAFGRNATLTGLSRLSDAIENRFHGGIFPLAKKDRPFLTNEVVALVASVFEGDSAAGQMHLGFQAYDFSYIPVETLSEIYEQFLRAQGMDKLDGAVYTPEPLADYLICEVNSVKPLTARMKILDPCCGSGVFLVLAFQRLIEQKLQTNQSLSAPEIRKILVDSIYGIERNEEACRVATLSLILTMLNYIDPPELHKNKLFKFPDLLNTRIFNADFFNSESLFWSRRLKFDWILGNPPWIQPSTINELEKERFVLEWIRAPENQSSRPVLKNRVAEAFSWKVVECITSDGAIGLVLHAKSLFNHYSERYRKHFFASANVRRITNFSNLAYTLFDRRGEAPAYTVVYSPHLSERVANIIHCAPLVANQTASFSAIGGGQFKGPWMLTINEEEIRSVRTVDAASGDSSFWKFAMWGSPRDIHCNRRLLAIFDTRLGEIESGRRWNLKGGFKLTKEASRSPLYEVIDAPELHGRKVLNVDTMGSAGCSLQVPSFALRPIERYEEKVDVRSGKAGLLTAAAPHLILNLKYFAFSEEDFIIPKPHVGLSAPQTDGDHLRALSVILNSSFGRYLMFWRNASWGIERSQIASPKDIRPVNLPVLSKIQIRRFARIHKKLAELEVTKSCPPDEIRRQLDDITQQILHIPSSLRSIVDDFWLIRFTLNKGKTSGPALKPPKEPDLRRYGESMKSELDGFAFDGEIKHGVSIVYSPSLIVCEVSLHSRDSISEVTVKSASRSTEPMLKKLSIALESEYSQWFYVRRGMRIFEQNRVFVCKSPRLLDWTGTQAQLDARDIIAEASQNFPNENK